MRQEDPPHFLLFILNKQPPSLPLHPAPSHRVIQVCPIESFLWNKNAILGEPGVGLIPLLQDDYDVPRVLVCNVYPEVCLQGRCPSASLHRAPNRERIYGKDTQYCAGVPSLSRISPPPPPPLGGGGGVASPCPTPCCCFLSFVPVTVTR